MPPRRTTLRGARLNLGGDGSRGDNGGDTDADDTVMIWQIPRQEVGVAGRSTAGRHEGGDPQDRGFVRLRAKSESAASSRAKSLKRKWRNSDVFLPRLLTEALQQARAEEGGDKGRTLLEKARELPGYMKKITHVLFKASKDADQADYGARRSGASTFYLEVGQLPEELPEGVLGEASDGEVLRGPRRLSPSHRGGGFMRPRTLNWNQKYQRAMLQSKAKGPDICVTSPETPCSPGGQEGEGDGKGLLGRIMGQLRPRSTSIPISTSTQGLASISRSRLSVSAPLLLIHPYIHPSLTPPALICPALSYQPLALLVTHLFLSPTSRSPFLPFTHIPS